MSNYFGLRLQANTERYLELMGIKEAVTNSGEEFVMDDSMRFLFDRDFREKTEADLRKEMDEESETSVPKATSGQSPMSGPQSVDSGFSEANTAMLDGYVKTLVKQFK